MRQRRLVRAISPLAFLALMGAGATIAHSQTLNYFSDLPEFQRYSYPVGSADGPGSVRSRAASFAFFSEKDSSGQTIIVPGDGLAPSRRATFMIGADTSAAIPILANPSRYRIDSVRVTTTLMGSVIYEPAGFVLPYDGTIDSSASLSTPGADDPGRPVELFGAEFQTPYTMLGFNDESGPQFFHADDLRWPDATTPYRYFAVDATGRDAENSVGGGYSATELAHHTAPFTPAPFAVGKVYSSPGQELAQGTHLQLGDVFQFDLDLAQPGVVTYVQQSLATGRLGFQFSALNEPTAQIATAAYPDFYLDVLPTRETAGQVEPMPNPDGNGPTIAIQVTTLPDGDYDADADIDGADFLQWQRQNGGAANPPGYGSDGHVDGLVNFADYVTWRDHFGTHVPAFAAAAATPEPGAMGLAGWALAALVAQRQTKHRRSERLEE